MRARPPKPVDTVRVAWRDLRAAPSVWLVRIGWQVASHAGRFVGAFLVGLWFVAHLGSHLATGAAFTSWPGALAETLSQPHVFVGLSGLLFTAALLFLAMESWVFAAMWGSVRDLGRQRRPNFWSVAGNGHRQFDRALTVRMFVRLTEMSLFAVVLGTLAGTYRLSAGWELLPQAFAWATALTMLTAGVLATRLTAELTAAAMFVDDLPLGVAIENAALHVVSYPVHIYRLFILSAAALLPPFALAWFAAITQNIFVSFGYETVAWVLRVSAEMLVAVGIGMFSVLLHGTFFAYYARTEVAGASMAKHHSPSLTELLPKTYEYVVDVEEVLAAEHPNDRPGGGGEPGAPLSDEPFNLEAILNDAGDPERK